MFGDRFERSLTGSGDRHAFAAASLEIVRAVTGHNEAALFDQVAASESCGWITERSGEVLAVGDVEDLPNRLLEAAVYKPSPEWIEWRDCVNERDGNAVTSSSLPAGIYMTELRILTYGGHISEYVLDDLGNPDAATVTPDVSDTRRLTLDSSELHGLASGWQLRMLLVADEGREATASCYAKAAPSPLEMVGQLWDSNGERVARPARETTYTLRVDMHPYVCPIDASGFTLEPDFPATPIRNEACRDGSIVDFEYYSGFTTEVRDLKQIFGEITPVHSVNVWADPAFDVRVAVDIRLEPLPPEPEPFGFAENAPNLSCSQASDGADQELPRLEGGFEGNLVVAECAVSAPGAGSSVLNLMPGNTDLGWHFQSADGVAIDGPVDVRPGDADLNVSVVSDPLTSAPWVIQWQSEVRLDWQVVGEGPVPAHLATQRSQLVGRFDRLQVFVPSFHCGFEPVLELVNADRREVPTDRLLAATDCQVVFPNSDDLGVSSELLLTIGPAPVVPGATEDTSQTLLEPVDWLFATGDEIVSESADTLVVSPESVEGVEGPINLISTEPLENRRWLGTTSTLIEAEWLVDGRTHSTLQPETLSLDLDLRARSNPMLALLLTAIAAAGTYLLLFLWVWRSTRLPSHRLVGIRRRFNTQVGANGSLSSHQLNAFNLNDYQSQLDRLRPSRKELQFGDLTLTAKHPAPWQPHILLDGGWTEVTTRDDSAAVYFAPNAGGHRDRAPRHFNDLTAIVLDTNRGDSGPIGMLYVLVPSSRRSGYYYEDSTPSNLIRGARVSFDSARSRRQLEPVSSRAAVPRESAEDSVSAPARANARPPSRVDSGSGAGTSSRPPEPPRRRQRTPPRRTTPAPPPDRRPPPGRSAPPRRDHQPPPRRPAPGRGDSRPPRRQKSPRRPPPKRPPGY